MDANFLKALRSGDAEAFNALVADYRDRVVSTCYRFLGNREDAEDTALDVFVEVHRSLPGFREEAQLSTWIYRIAVTKSLDILRRRKRKKRFVAFLSGPSAAEVEPESLPSASEKPHSGRTANPPSGPSALPGAHSASISKRIRIRSGRRACSIRPSKGSLSAMSRPTVPISTSCLGMISASIL